jgi:hypothetical protein
MDIELVQDGGDPDIGAKRGTQGSRGSDCSGGDDHRRAFAKPGHGRD